MEDELVYEIDGEQLTINEETKRDLNILAARLYLCLGHQCKEGFDFSASTHPQEQMIWGMALNAYYMHVVHGIFD